MDTGSTHKVKGLIEDLSISKNADGANYDVVFRIAGTEIRAVLYAHTVLEAEITSKYGTTFMGWPYLAGVKLHMQLTGDLAPAGDAAERYRDGAPAPGEGDYWTLERKAGISVVP